MPKIKLSISNNYSDLDKFLKKHKVQVQGGTYTHISISHPKGYYYIPKEERDEFFKKYYQHVFVKKLPAYLTEGIRDCNITPIKIDLDFRAWQKVDENEHPKRSSDHFLALISSHRVPEVSDISEKNSPVK